MSVDKPSLLGACKQYCKTVLELREYSPLVSKITMCVPQKYRAGVLHVIDLQVLLEQIKDSSKTIRENLEMCSFSNINHPWKEFGDVDC